jgi:multimeric flavodoxin WrbA
VPPATVLVVCHSRTGSTAALRDAVLAGMADAGDDVRVVALDATDAGVDDVEAADGVLLATPARFGAVAGLTKDFLERIYPWFEEVPMRRPGMPYALVVKGTTDASGAVRDVQRILTGLRWRAALPPLVVEGDLRAADLAAARELGATFAAGVGARLW